jgi:hypothetical protein
MAGPPQFQYGDDGFPANVAAVKTTVKRLDDDGRAHLLAWLCMYYRNHGAMFSSQITGRRQRIALHGIGCWLVKVPKR